MIVEMISEARQGYEHYESMLRACEDAYFMRLSPSSLEFFDERNMSHIYYPKINSKCKRITDSLNEAYFNSDKFSKLEPYINSDPMVIRKWQEGIDHYTEMLSPCNVFQPMFQEAPYRGTNVAKVYWSGDRAFIDHIDLRDIWFDRRARTNEDIRYIVNNIYLTIEDIKSLQKRGFFSKKLKIDEMIVATSPSERFMLQEVYYIDEGNWYVTTLYNESEFLRRRVYLKDGHPFVWGYLLAQTKGIDEEDYVCAYGEPPVMSILPLQQEMNEIRNKMMDAMRQHLSPKVIAQRSSGISRIDLETIGKPIFTTNPAQIQIAPLPNVQEAQRNFNLAEQEMSETIGVSPMQNGITPSRKETATMASILANEGSVRLQGYIRTFNETFFEKVFERLAMLVWKYGDAMFFSGIDRSELPSYKVTLNTGIGALNKEVQKRGLLEAYGVLNQQFQMFLAVQDVDSARRIVTSGEKVLKEVLPLFGIKNSDEFLGEKNELEEGIVNR